MPRRSKRNQNKSSGAQNKSCGVSQKNDNSQSEFLEDTVIFNPQQNSSTNADFQENDDAAVALPTPTEAQENRPAESKETLSAIWEAINSLQTAITTVMQMQSKGDQISNIEKVEILPQRSSNSTTDFPVIDKKIQIPSNAHLPTISQQAERKHTQANFLPLPNAASSSQQAEQLPSQSAQQKQSTKEYYQSAAQQVEFVAKLYHLPYFDGKPEEWPLFLATYEDTTLEFGYSNRQNLIRLQKALQGAAKDCVLSMLIYPENVPQVIEELKFNFGRPDLLIKSQLDKVKMYPAVTEGRLEGILGLSTCAKNIVAFFKSAKCHNHLLNPTLLEQLVQKLPMSKQFEWARFSLSLTQAATVEDFAKWIGDLAHCCSVMPQRSSVSTSENYQLSRRRVLHSSEVQHAAKKCQECKGDHNLTECRQFKNLDTNAKWEKIKSFRICFACLHRGHLLRECPNKRVCQQDGCSRFHHPLLHQNQESRTSTLDTAQPSHVLQFKEENSTCKLFKIMPVVIYGPNGSTEVYALFDDGSTVSFIDEDIAKYLGLRGQKSSLTVRWYDNVSKTEHGLKVSAEISSVRPGCKRFGIRNMQTVKKLDLPVQSMNKNDFEHLKGLPIESYQNKKPLMLIGLDNCYLSLPEKIAEDGPDLPVAMATKLGWVVYGPTSIASDNVARVCHINENSTLEAISSMVNEYFSVESFGVKATDLVLESDDDKRAREILKIKTIKLDGRYETGLLWRHDDVVLPNSIEMAKQRLIKIENKMAKDPVYAANYKKEIDKYISKGYARLLSSKDLEKDSHHKTWYLPHFGVVNPHKPEKLRIVFDAAAMSSNVSLNSALLKGPEHAKPLQTILFQFRQGRIAVAGDIQEMFSQVSIAADDQNSQRFLWRNGDQARDMQVYVMQSMIFGAICSPCCAEYVKNYNASQFQVTMPRGVKAVINNTYVDDLVVSFNNHDEALEVSNEAIQINCAAGFKLRNFSSNCNELEGTLNNGNGGELKSINMEKQNETDKVLGLFWNKSSDCFEFHVKFHKVCKEVLEDKRSPTKRELLSIVMSIFDPFGFLANFTIFSKLLLQKTWKLCLQWDEQLPASILSQWRSWWNEFNKVKELSIPRCYSSLLSLTKDIQLHIFVDASSSAYAAVAYLRIKHQEDVQISFVMGKSRCAPPKGMTIPRLELQAAVLGCRLKNCIEESHEFKIGSTFFWSDSKTVILWIKSTTKEYKQFVACRIAEILSSTTPSQWRWLPTELNIADDATRAKIPTAFESNSTWLTGPEFLKYDEDLWPTFPPSTSFDESAKVEVIDRSLLVSSTNKSPLNFDRFSSFIKLKRCAAWMLRFINVYVKKIKIVGSELTAAEIEAGEKLICRLVQMEVFTAERLCLLKGDALSKSSSIYSLTPFIDNDFLLRVNGRLNNAIFLPESARQPIIMPTYNSITLLIVSYFHQKRHHQNDNLIMNEVRQKFWVPNIRQTLRRVKKMCPVCIRDSAKPSPPLMGQLPIDRLTPYVRPFTYTGLDYCGPFHVAIGRRREKRWIALFTCLSTRAIHLEVAADLSTDAFLICLRNFVNRRGVPIRIRSDNGTNFIGAQREMKPENRIFDFEIIQKNLVKENIEWIFNCPANPHEGGCWERLVRSVKLLLNKVLKEEAPRLETFQSAIIEAECIINNRPLTQLPIHPDSEEPLTPNHFLIGGLNSTQTPSREEEKVCLRKQWRIAQNLKDRLWKRWVVEYLPQLLIRPKWREGVDPLKPGDTVIILDHSLPRSQWKMGTVSNIFQGKDGHVRSAEVKTTNGLIRRPAVKLAVLAFNESSSWKGFTGGGMLKHSL